MEKLFLQSARPAILLGASGVVVTCLVGLVAPATTVRAWLLADLFFLGLSLGALLILMIHNLTGGAWGEPLLRPLFAMAGALPVALVAMALPMLARSTIMRWADDPTLSARAVSKLAYLDPGLVALRTLACFAVWVAVVWSLSVWQSARAISRPAASTSILGLIGLTVTTLFFATDWMVSLDPDFYSTIYGVLEQSGQLVGAFALALLIAIAADSDAGRRALPSGDIGNLFLGFVLLWVYLVFMQWLIVWSGNLSDEIGWYLHRGTGVWLFLLLALVLLHGVIPVAALLSGRVKASPSAMAAVAAAVLLGHFLDVAWRLGPDLGNGDLLQAVATLATLLAVGGFWTAGCAWLLVNRNVTREAANA
jgi:hypothetical protein